MNDGRNKLIRYTLKAGGIRLLFLCFVGLKSTPPRSFAPLEDDTVGVLFAHTKRLPLTGKLANREDATTDLTDEVGIGVRQFRVS